MSGKCTSVVGTRSAGRQRDELERLQREEEVARWREKRESLERTTGFLQELKEAVEALTRAELLASAYHKRRGNGGGNVKALELSKEAKNRLVELRALSDKAQNGDKVARQELRKAVRESPRQVLDEALELAKRGQWALIKTAAAGEALMEEALVAKLELMRLEIGGPDPTPLEILLTERVVSLWILLEVLELLNSAQLTGVDTSQRIPHSFLKFYLGWQEQAHRRFLSAIRELVKVRRLQSGLPSSQTNVQINLR